MNKICGIYLIESPAKELYVGQSINIHSRFYGYKLLYCKGQPSLYNSFIKHGVDNHIFSIIETCNQFDLRNNEIFYINYFRYLGFKMLNIALGGGIKQAKKVIETQKDKQLSTHEYYHKHLFTDYILNENKKQGTYIVYRAILNQILAQFPAPENTTQEELSEFICLFKNNKTRKNICIILKWLFNVKLEKHYAIHSPTYLRDVVSPLTQKAA